MKQHTQALLCVLAALLALAFPACVVPDDELATLEPLEDPITKDYGVLPTLQFSMLREMDKAVDRQGSRRIRYPVCITSDTQVGGQVIQRYIAQEQESYNRWNDALKGETGWRVQRVTLYRVGNLQTCPRTDQGLRVYNSDARRTTTRANAAFDQYRQNISVNDLRQADWRLNLHELGHQLGLGDTYSEPSYQTPEGQPRAVMNKTWEVSDFTQDDIDAVRHIWWMIRTGSNDHCADGYRNGRAPVNRGRTRFCVPLASGDDDTGDDGGGQCRNRADEYQCNAWARMGNCSNQYGPWMQQNCCAACRGTGGGNQCRNVADNYQCDYWARAGNCSNQYGPWMQQNCCASCRR